MFFPDIKQRVINKRTYLQYTQIIRDVDLGTGLWLWDLIYDKSYDLYFHPSFLLQLSKNGQDEGWDSV